MEATVWDLAGRRVADLSRRWYPAGSHVLEWDGRTDRGGAAAGTYVVSLTAAGRTVSRKVTLVK